MNLFHLAWQYAHRRALLWMSTVAIALGVAVLFTVQAVVNGYLHQVEITLRSFVGDTSIESPSRVDSSPQELAKLLPRLQQIPELRDIEVRFNWFGLVGRRGARSISNPRSADLSGLLLVGVDDCPPGQIRLGKAAAESLGALSGEELEIISFHTGQGGRPVPVRQSFTIGDTFTTGRFDQDLDRALVNRTELTAMFGRDGDWNQLVLRAHNSVSPEHLTKLCNTAILEDKTSTLLARSWRESGGNFLRAVESQKGILQTIFLIVVLVAAYQLVATLTLTVAEKKRDIGVLGAMGATPTKIVSFFVYLGLMVASLGCGLGILLGLWTTSNLESIELFLGGGEPIFTAEVYKFDEIPVLIDTQATLSLVAITLSAAVIFSFLPAWRASRKTITEALSRR